MLTNSVTRCPCCGANVDKSRFLIDLNSNFAVINGEPIRLTPMEAVILHALVEVYPQSISQDRLISICYGGLEPENGGRASIQTTMSHLRNKLRPRATSILGHNKTYRLMMPMQNLPQTISSNVI